MVSHKVFDVHFEEIEKNKCKTISNIFTHKE